MVPALELHFISSLKLCEMLKTGLAAAFFVLSIDICLFYLIVYFCMGVLKPPVFTLGKIKQLHKALIQECLNMFPRHKYPILNYFWLWEAYLETIKHQWWSFFIYQWLKTVNKFSENRSIIDVWHGFKHASD